MNATPGIPVLQGGEDVNVRFAEARTKVVSKARDVSPSADLPLLPLQSTCLAVVQTAAGPLVVTSHALKRFELRFSQSGADQSWHRLRTALTDRRATRVRASRPVSRGECWRFDQASSHLDGRERPRLCENSARIFRPARTGASFKN